MTDGLRLSDIDPELAADEALNAPDPEPDTLSDQDIDRRVTALWFLRAEIAETEARFAVARARLDYNEERALSDPRRRADELEHLIAAWAERRQVALRAVGVPERRIPKSWGMSYGAIRSRRTSRVEVDGPVESLPEAFVRVKVEADKTALAKLPVDGEGRLIDETGEVLPARRVESVSWRIDTGDDG